MGCRGIRVPRSHDEDEAGPELFEACLAHIDDSERRAYLATLHPGSDLNHRGTPFTEHLLGALLDALRDPDTGHLRIGRANFGSAIFQGDVLFESAIFEDIAVFESAIFEDIASFESAIFQGIASFAWATFQESPTFERATFQDGAFFTAATFQGRASFGSATFEYGAFFRSAIFEGIASFEQATFQGNTLFALASFQGDVRFRSAIFQGIASFEQAIFQGNTLFALATFERDARFEEAVFERSVVLGPLLCAGEMTLSGAVFHGPVTLWFAARRLRCRRTRWLSTAELHLRYATVDFAHAVFEYPLTIAAEAEPFVANGHPLAEEPLADGSDVPVRVTSLRGVDAAHLVLADIDLSRCLITGAVHLDQIRLEGACSFDEAPPGTHWRCPHPVRFTWRRTLAEEQHWRASRPEAVRGWNVAVFGAGHVGPAQLAPAYRALRKAVEDGKNEPGAADFYYGEMEMRRYDPRTPAAERMLLTLYWAVSGYGLRASRALGWLLCTMTATVLLMLVFGLPDTPARSHPPGSGVIGKQHPQLQASFTSRFTVARTEKAVDVVVNSVVFRSSGKDLTTAGRYIERASRFAEPTLLALAVLAIRGRVKR